MNTAGYALLFIGCAALIGALSVPLMLKRIPPNPIYGFRTARTMSSEEVWYPANRFCGRQLLFAAVIQAVVNISILLIAPDLPAETAAAIGTATLLITLIGATVRSLLYLRRLPSGES